MTDEEALNLVIRGRYPECDAAIVYAMKKRVPEQWRCLAHNRFYGIDEYGEPIYRAGGRTYVHRECGYKSAVGSNFCPRCGQRMTKEGKE